MEITLPRRRSARRAGVRFHVGRLPEEEVTVVGGLPVTSVGRTLADLFLTGQDFDAVVRAAADAHSFPLLDRD